MSNIDVYRYTISAIENNKFVEYGLFQGLHYSYLFKGAPLSIDPEEMEMNPNNESKLCVMLNKINEIGLTINEIYKEGYISVFTVKGKEDNEYLISKIREYCNLFGLLRLKEYRYSLPKSFIIDDDGTQGLINKNIETFRDYNLYVCINDRFYTEDYKEGELLLSKDNNTFINISLRSHWFKKHISDIENIEKIFSEVVESK